MQAYRDYLWEVGTAEVNRAGSYRAFFPGMKLN